jgi:hypothetical protein
VRWRLIFGAIVFAVLISIFWIWKIFVRDRFDLASPNIRQTWRPIISMPWLNYGFDFGGDTGGMKGASSEADLDAWFGRMEQEGIQAVAWFLFADGRAALKFDSSGYVLGVTPTFQSDYHRVLRLAAKHRLQIIWVLTDYELGMPVQTAGDLRMFGHADLFEDQGKRTSFIQRALNPILRDVDDSRQIAGWLLINEPENMIRSGQVTESGVRAFVRETAAAIKHYRPIQRVGLADADLTGMMEFADIDALDFLVFHHYRSVIPPPAAFVRGYLSERLKINKPRPIFIGEFNLNRPPGSDLGWFVKTSETLGYAGVWPWSLRNRPNETGNQATDVDPQFTELRAYADSVRSPNKNGRAWVVSQLKQVLLPEIDRRIARLQDKPDPENPYLRREASFQLDWDQTLKQQLEDEHAIGSALDRPLQ